MTKSKKATFSTIIRKSTKEDTSTLGKFNLSTYNEDSKIFKFDK